MRLFFSTLPVGGNHLEITYIICMERKRTKRDRKRKRKTIIELERIFYYFERFMVKLTLSFGKNKFASWFTTIYY